MRRSTRKSMRNTLVRKSTRTSPATSRKTTPAMSPAISIGRLSQVEDPKLHEKVQEELKEKEGGV